MLNAIKPKTRTVVLYLMVPVAMFIFTVFVPLITAFVYSFFEWKGGPQKTFTGLTNYITLFHDGTFWQAFGHISIWLWRVLLGRSVLPLF